MYAAQSAGHTAETGTPDYDAARSHFVVTDAKSPGSLTSSRRPPRTMIGWLEP